MTIRFFNDNPRFGDIGPFEANSKDALIQEMDSAFRQWTYENTDYDNSQESFDAIKSEIIDDFAKSLRPEYLGKPRLIFDKNDNVTIQIPGFCYTYKDMEDLSNVINGWFEDEESVLDLDSDPESYFEPTNDELHDGLYNIEDLVMFCLAENAPLYRKDSSIALRELRGRLFVHGTGFFYNWYVTVLGNIEEWISLGFDGPFDIDPNGTTIARSVIRELHIDEFAENANEIWECYAGEAVPYQSERQDFLRWLSAEIDSDNVANNVTNKIEWKSDGDWPDFG